MSRIGRYGKSVSAPAQSRRERKEPERELHPGLAAHLAAGRLMEVLPDWSEPFPGPMLYYPSRRHPPSALSAFVAFVQARRRREGW